MHRVFFKAVSSFGVIGCLMPTLSTDILPSSQMLLAMPHTLIVQKYITVNSTRFWMSYTDLNKF